MERAPTRVPQPTSSGVAARSGTRPTEGGPSGSVDATTLPERLRAATRAAHARVEQTPSFVALSRGTLTVPAYVAWLERLLGFHAPLERIAGAREEWSALGVDFEPRRRAPLLVDDLLALGRAPGDLEAIPECTSLPPHDTFGAVLGCVYVLEGSTLGGVIVSRALRRLHGLGPTAGCAYFASRGRDVTASWVGFRAALQLHGERDRPEPVIGAALGCFDALGTWLGGRVEGEERAQSGEAPEEGRDP